MNVRKNIKLYCLSILFLGFLFIALIALLVSSLDDRGNQIFESLEKEAYGIALESQKLVSDPSYLGVGWSEISFETMNYSIGDNNLTRIVAGEKDHESTSGVFRITKSTYDYMFVVAVAVDCKDFVYRVALVVDGTSPEDITFHRVQVVSNDQIFVLSETGCNST